VLRRENINKTKKQRLSATEDMNKALKASREGKSIRHVRKYIAFGNTRGMTGAGGGLQRSLMAAVAQVRHYGLNYL
jgi:hypothetical protein